MERIRPVVMRVIGKVIIRVDSGIAAERVEISAPATFLFSKFIRASILKAERSKSKW